MLTNLGRMGSPVIRYRTGDRVSLMEGRCDCGRHFHRLDGGVIGRVDDVIIVRGVNVFPSAIENVIRRFREVGEFAVSIYREHELDEMEIRVEVMEGDRELVAAAVAKEVRNGLGLRVHVNPVPHGTLPRFDLKARRFSDQRKVPAGAR